MHLIGGQDLGFLGITIFNTILRPSFYTAHPERVAGTLVPFVGEECVDVGDIASRGNIIENHNFIDFTIKVHS